MTIICSGPDPDLGIALRLAGYLDCQARALGENGFQALTGGPLMAGMLPGLVTIFVALIGYRMILGALPSLRDGVGWAVRLGVVLALVTAWPAYQTLVYGVAVDAPGQLATVVLPAAGLPVEDLDGRVQMAYDTIRLGSTSEPVQVPSPQSSAQPGQPQPAPAQAQAIPGAQPPLPQTAAVLVLSTSGMMAALRVATGILLAVGPLAIMALLFDATLGLFSGWVRALAGTALAMLAASIVTAIDLVMIESELARIQSYNLGGIAAAVDPQAVTTLVLVFSLVMLIAVLAAVRMATAFRMPAIGAPWPGSVGGTVAAAQTVHAGAHTVSQHAQDRETGVAAPSRVAAVADALATTVRREQMGGHVAAGEASRRTTVLHAGGRSDAVPAVVPLGIGGRRSIGRRTASAARRDRTI